MYEETLKKMKIRAGMKGVVINSPPDLEAFASFLSTNGYISSHNTEFDFAIAFVSSSEQVASVAHLAYDLKFDALLWMVYPKKTSKIESNITRDNGWNALTDIGYQGVALVSFDNNWSAFRFRSQSLIKSTKKL